MSFELNNTLMMDELAWELGSIMLEMFPVVTTRIEGDTIVVSASAKLGEVAA